MGVLLIVLSTGASKVVPVVHIVRRLQWEQVAAAEKDLPGDAPVTAPTSNRSGKRTRIPAL